MGDHHGRKVAHSLRRAFAIGAAALALAAFAAACGGSGDGDARGAPTTTMTTPAMTEPGSGEVDGAQVFADNCASCHGTNGAGGHLGPNLQLSATAEDLDSVVQQVRNGGGQMPAFKDTLTNAEIQAVARHVVNEIAPRS